MEKINRKEFADLFRKTVWPNMDGYETSEAVLQIFAMLMDKIDELCDEIDKLKGK